MRNSEYTSDYNNTVEQKNYELVQLRRELKAVKEERKRHMGKCEQTYALLMGHIDLVGREKLIIRGLEKKVAVQEEQIKAQKETIKESKEQLQEASEGQQEMQELREGLRKFVLGGDK